MTTMHNIKIIEKNKKWYFQLWYFGKQEMGESKPYNTQKECEDGIEYFKNYIIKEGITSECDLAKTIDVDSKYCQYIFFDYDKTIIYQSRLLEKRNKKNCKKSLESTCKNFIEAKVTKIERK